MLIINYIMFDHCNSICFVDYIICVLFYYYSMTLYIVLRVYIQAYIQAVFKHTFKHGYSIGHSIDFVQVLQFDILANFW